MAKMLKHKETGELFIFTPLLAQNSFLEMVVEDPIAEVIAEMKAAEAAPVVETPVIEPAAAKAVKPKKQKSAVDDDLAAALE